MESARCIQSASGGRERMSLYSAFVAASVLQGHVIQDTEKLLDTLPSVVIPTHARRFPAVSRLRKYPPSPDDYINFEASCLTDNPTAFCTLQRSGADEELVLTKFA